MRCRETRFSEFPLEEYLERVRRLRVLMETAGMDAVLLTHPKLLRYFAGGPLTGLFEDTFNPFFFLLPLDPSGDAALVMSSGREGACRTSWVPEQVFWGYGRDASLMSQNTSLECVASVIARKGLEAASIVIELDAGMRLGMTQEEYGTLSGLLPGARWRSCSPLAWKVAERKSPAELGRIRAATGITCRAFERAFSEAHVGMTEKELAAIIQRVYFEQGATGAGFLAVFAGRERGIWADALPSDYAIRRGDLLMLDGGCQVDGYVSDVSRMASFGPPAERDRDLYEAARRANAAALAAVRPGVRMRDLHAAGQRPYVEAGLGDLLVFGSGQLGHGIGLSLHEYPDISATSVETLEPGMVIAVEPAISDRPRWEDSQQFYIVENDVAVTQTGHEMLTPLTDELVRVG